MIVPFLDLAAATRELRHELQAAWESVTERGWFVRGEEVRAFEEEFAAYVGARHGVGVGCGLDALELSLRAMDIGSGDEVIVPANTYIATWLAVMGCGATPVPVEPRHDTYTIDPGVIEPAVTPRTRAIVPVHLYGQAAEMTPIMELARRRGIKVLCDAAQAHGARYRGKPVGAYGDACAWSFYPSKNLGALGDGGAVTSDDADLIERVRVLGNYGSAVKNVHRIPGRNSRLDELQAAILRVKLRCLDEWNARRARAAERYTRALGDTGLTVPAVPEWAAPVWHLFVVRSARRDDVVKDLATAGVQTQIHYPTPPYRQPACRGLGLEPSDFPVTESIHREVVSLPIGPHLSDEHLTASIAAVREVTARLERVGA